MLFQAAIYSRHMFKLSFSSNRNLLGRYAYLVGSWLKEIEFGVFHRAGADFVRLLKPG
jgi:hypothetical protein